MRMDTLLNCYVQQVYVQMPVSTCTGMHIVWVEGVTTWSYLVVFDYK